MIQIPVCFENVLFFTQELQLIMPQLLLVYSMKSIFFTFFALCSIVKRYGWDCGILQHQQNQSPETNKK